MGDILSGFDIPRAYVVQLSKASRIIENIFHFAFLSSIHLHAAKKRRVAHDVAAFRRGQHVVPVDAQGVRLDDVGGIAQREVLGGDVEKHVGLVVRLELRDPKRRAGNVGGEIIYLYAVELRKRDTLFSLLGLVAEYHLDLAVVEFGEHIVLQTAKRQVGLGEEIARTSRGVEELKGCKLLTEAAQGVISLARRHALLRADGVELLL